MEERWLVLWRDFGLLLLLSVAALAPLWYRPYPAMADLPQHAEQVALLRSVHYHAAPFRTLFRIHWFTPYLLGYLAVYLLAPVTGVLAAAKIGLSFFVAGFPLVTGYLLRLVRVPPYWAVLCIPCVYGFTYQWGFFNFLIAVPLGLLFFALVLRVREQPGVRWMAALGCSTVLLFFCHALICAFFGLCALVLFTLERRGLRAWLRCVLPMAAVLPVALLWLKRTSRSAGASRPRVWDLNWRQSVDPYYMLHSVLHAGGGNWGRVWGLAGRLLGAQPSLQIACAAAVLFVLPLAAGLRLQRRLAAWAPMAVCLMVLLLCPHTLFGTDFVYERFTLFLLPCFLLGLREGGQSRRRRLVCQVLASLLVLGFVAREGRRASRFHARAQGFTQALAYMEPQQRVLSMVFDHDDSESIAPVFLHFPHWYSAQKEGVVDPSAAMMHPELVVYRRGMLPRAVLWDFEWNPQRFSWAAYNGGQYRYFLVRSANDVAGLVFAKSPCPVVMRFHQKEWWLYENVGCPGAGGQ